MSIQKSIYENDTVISGMTGFGKSFFVKNQIYKNEGYRHIVISSGIEYNHYMLLTSEPFLNVSEDTIKEHLKAKDPKTAISKDIQEFLNEYDRINISLNTIEMNKYPEYAKLFIQTFINLVISHSANDDNFIIVYDECQAIMPRHPNNIKEKQIHTWYVTHTLPQELSDIPVKIFFKQDPSVVKELETICPELTNKDISEIENLQTIKREFSEAFILSPKGTEKITIKVKEPLEYWFMTSDKADLDFIQKFQKDNHQLHYSDCIEIIAEEIGLLPLEKTKFIYSIEVIK